MATQSPTFLSMMKTRRALIPIVGLVAIWWLFVTIGSNSGVRISRHGLSNSATTSRTQNRTLGFGEILMAVLPERTDQIDTIALTSYYTGIDITIVDGVTEVVDKALPPGRGVETMSKPERGCWRVHLNMLRHVVEKRLETALIMEADADWDVRLKEQLALISSNIPDATPEYPYGFSWMYLWFGVCRHSAKPEDPQTEQIISFPDPTVESMDDQKAWVKEDAQLYGISGSTRSLYPARTPHCTTSYAITLEGARRALYEIGYDHLNKAIDLEYSRLAYEGMTPGLIVHPPLMAQWKTGTEKDSDIPRNQSWKPESHGGTSGPQVRQSIRKSLRDLTYGVEEVVKEEEQEQEPLAA